MSLSHHEKDCLRKAAYWIDKAMRSHIIGRTVKDETPDFEHLDNLKKIQDWLKEKGGKYSKTEANKEPLSPEFLSKIETPTVEEGAICDRDADGPGSDSPTQGA